MRHRHTLLLLPLILLFCLLPAAFAWRVTSHTVPSPAAPEPLPPASTHLCYLSGLVSLDAPACGCSIEDGAGGRVLAGCEGCTAACVEWAGAAASPSLDGPGPAALTSFAPGNEGAGRSGCAVHGGAQRSTLNATGGATCSAERVVAPAGSRLWRLEDVHLPKDLRDFATETHICVLGEIDDGAGEAGAFSCVLGVRGGDWRLDMPRDAPCRVSCYTTDCPCYGGTCLEGADGGTECNCTKKWRGAMCDLLVPHHNAALLYSLMLIVTAGAGGLTAVLYGRQKWSDKRSARRNAAYATVGGDDEDVGGGSAAEEEEEDNKNL